MASRTTLDGVLEALPWASTWSRLALWKRRAIKTVVALILVSSALYRYAMIVFEGRSQSYGRSLQVVIETATGTANSTPTSRRRSSSEATRKSSSSDGTRASTRAPADRGEGVERLLPGRRYVGRLR
jgi:hypothetical protein